MAFNPPSPSLLVFYRLIIAGTTKRLVFVFFTQKHASLVGHDAMRYIGKVATFHADGMHFGDILSHGTKCRHRAKRLTLKVHIQAGNNHTFALIGQSRANLDKTLIEKLRLVYAHHIGFGGQEEDGSSSLNRR